jgi:autotransporter-associated beta strand protein
MKNKRLLLFPSSIAAGILLVSPNLHALAVTWDAGGANNNWSTIDNWSDNLAATGDDVTFNATGALASGTTNTVDASISIASLTYSQESSTLQHTTAIAAGQTLTVAGNFTLGGSPTATAATNVTLTGSTGTLTVGGTSFQIGQPTPTAGSTTANLDMSGLGTFNANLGTTGIFRLGPNSTSTTGAVATAKLAATSTITADLLGVGDRSGRGGTHILKLGSVANTINANTINVGTNSGRANGELSFETSTGTLKIRAADRISAATMNLINNAFGTGNNVTGIADFAGHSVDAKIGTLTMGRRVGGTTSTATSTFTFDTGTLEVATLNLAQNGSAASTAGTINATMNIGGGVASFDAITMATNTGGAATTANATLNLTGGTTTVNGNIVRGGGSGITNATVSLSGGTLDMTNGNIGDGTNAVTLTLQSGTLKNVAQINGGADFTKASAGSFTFSGANTFTGGINMSGGEVTLDNSGSLGIGTKNINVQVGAYLALDGSAGNITLASGISYTTAGQSFLNTAGNNVINGSVTVSPGNGTTLAISDGGSLEFAGAIGSASSNRNFEISGTSIGANKVSGAIGDGAGGISLVKSGSGTWTITNNSNTYTGNTNINDGKLVVNGNISTSALTTVGVDGTLAGNGTAGKTVINGTLAVGNSPGSMIFTDTLDLNGTTIMEIDGTVGAGVTGGHDFINLTGAGAAGVLTYGGALTLDIGTIFGIGSYSWNLFDMANETGTFSTIALADQYTGSLLDGDLDGIWDLTSGSNSWQFTESTGVMGLTVIPEPTSAALLGGFGVLALLRRRRA